MPGTSADVTIYSVTRSSAGASWIARAENTYPFEEEYQSKDAAFAAARVQARGHPPSVVRVYRPDGTVESTRHYGTAEDHLET